MTATDKLPVSKTLSVKEIRRYALQIKSSAVGLSGQEKIKQTKVLVIGAGGRGACIIQCLATAGIGKIGICDNAPVEESELSNQFLYGNSDLGKQKAIISKQKLLEINHLTEYELHNVFLNELNYRKIAENYDILVDATQSFESKYIINKASITLNKPLVYGFINGSEGEVSVFNYNQGPSLKCLYSSSPSKDKADTILNYVGLVSLVNILGSIMANEIIKLALTMETPLSGNLLQYNSLNYSFSSKPVIRNPKNFIE